jgi:hypothetical protein
VWCVVAGAAYSSSAARGQDPHHRPEPRTRVAVRIASSSHARTDLISNVTKSRPSCVWWCTPAAPGVRDIKDPGLMSPRLPVRWFVGVCAHCFQQIFQVSRTADPVSMSPRSCTCVCVRQQPQVSLRTKTSVQCSCTCVCGSMPAALWYHEDKDPRSNGFPSTWCVHSSFQS